MKKERKVIVKLIKKDNIHNHRLVEFFVKRINEIGIENRKKKEHL